MYLKFTIKDFPAKKYYESPLLKNDSFTFLTQGLVQSDTFF